MPSHGLLVCGCVRTTGTRIFGFHPSFNKLFFFEGYNNSVFQDSRTMQENYIDNKKTNAVMNFMNILIAQVGCGPLFHLCQLVNDFHSKILL